MYVKNVNSSNIIVWSMRNIYHYRGQVHCPPFALIPAWLSEIVPVLSTLMDSKFSISAPLMVRRVRLEYPIQITISNVVIIYVRVTNRPLPLFISIVSANYIEPGGLKLTLFKIYHCVGGVKVWDSFSTTSHKFETRCGIVIFSIHVQCFTLCLL